MDHFYLLRALWLMIVCRPYCNASNPANDPSELGNYMFPKPKIENVYEAWKPIDYGHPLVDPTIHYAPPELERVHIGPGPVPARPPKIHKHNLVFEAAREVRGHKDEELQAEVYNSPRYDKGLSLLSRLPIVQSSQRRNSLVPSRFQHQDQRHGRQENKRGHVRRKKPEKLKSGIYYVDDPYATFRDENELAVRQAQERVSDSDYDYFYEDYKDQREFDRRGNSPINQVVKFVPVSQISTPPTITTTEKPYGEIVNKDFYDELSAARQIQPLHRHSPPLKSARKVSVETGEQNTAYPLGNPYYNYYYNTHSQPAALQGVFGPPVPQLPQQENSYSNANQAGAGQNSNWSPADPEYSFNREMEYDSNQVIFSIKDSGELVDPRLADQEAEYYLVYASQEEESPHSSGPSQALNVTESDAEYPATPWAETSSEYATANTGVKEGDGNSELVYLVCMREVPRYLQSRLCKSPAPGRSTRFTEGEEDEETLVRLPPVPQFKFVQDNQYSTTAAPVFQERSLSQPAEETVPFSYVSSSQAEPASIIYSVAQSKVAVYKPNKQTTSTTTTTTTTSTTTTTPTTTASTTIRPFHYKLPPSEEPQNREVIIKKQHKRPLVFNKRPPNGSGSVSRPFEYLSRLSQFLSDRVFTGRTETRKDFASRPRPSLIMRRGSDS